MGHSKSCISVAVLFLITLPCKGGLFGEDFSYLSCSERRNVTIIFRWYTYYKETERLLEISLKPLIQNEACYIINIYDWQEERVIQLREDFNYNQIESVVLAEYTKMYDGKIRYEPKRLARDANIWNFFERLSNEATSNTPMKQTIAHMANTGGSHFLEKLHVEKKWDVIIPCEEYCVDDGWIYEWLSIHRNIVVSFRLLLIL